MSLQQTIREPITVTGIEPYGGNTVSVTVRPAEPNTGIVFRSEHGEVAATLSNARQTQSSIGLEADGAKFLVAEHFLATTYAYGIDNAYIEVTQHPTRNKRIMDAIGIGSKTIALPHIEGRQKTVCEAIDAVDVEKQPAERKVRKIDAPIETGKFNMYPIHGDDLLITATTVYPLPGEESHTLTVTPHNYRDEVSASRSYMKHIAGTLQKLPNWFLSAGAALAYPRAGIGHGFSESMFFAPVSTKEDWEDQEVYPAEIARHSIVDRLGAIALLGERLEGVHVETKFSGHKNDIAFLQEHCS